MTAEEKNHRIALLCGWTVSSVGWWSHPTLPDQGGAEPEPPNYYGSRDACSQFETLLIEKTLSGDSITDYINHLYHITFKPGRDRDYGVVFATAAQRCEAFLEVTSE